MATSSLYGNSSESIGLYGIGSASGGTYFEWFIFYDSATAPATPTGGSWSFTTNTGTPPTGWLASPPPSPTNQVWVSLAIVDSRSTAALTWSTPGLMSSMGSTIANYITFVATSAPAYSSGRLWYDSTQNALSYYNDITNNTIHIGQETQLKVRNTTGATIAKGAPVYVLPTASGFGYPLVALAQADTATKANCIGLANQAIANNTDGYICINGLLTGANTGTFAVGDVLYLSPYSAGQLMNTVPPTGYAVRIGVVAFSNTPNGTIYVNESNAFVLAGNIVGTIGITNGGTGATTASGARTSLGLGTIATQDANNVAITGGSIAGITDLAIADGGTGASSAAGALANLGAVGLTDTQTLTNKTISGASNTLTNIGNSSLTNSSVTINGSGISLGGTATITAATPNNLVFGAGLSATGNFNGSVATNVTLANVGTAATYGDSGTIPVFTTNAFGQISSVSLQSVVVDSTDISGTIAIAQGGTGASSAANARINLLPSYAGNAGEVLALNAGATDVEWRAVTGTGTVSSVAVSGGTTGLTTSGGPITAAGTITLAGTLGTANGGTNLTSFTSGGVVYASSTSALATSGNLTFSGTALDIRSNVRVLGSTTAAIAFNDGTTQSTIGFNGASAFTATTAYTMVIGTTANQPVLFNINSSEQMRLNSTGLGIGTSSPAYKLDVLSTGVPAQFSSSNASNTLIQHTNTNASKDLIYRFRQNAGAGNWYDLTMEGATNAFTIDYNDTTRITIDSAGNLGLGVTPSAWGGNYKAIQVGSVGSLSNYLAVAVSVGNNFYDSGAGAYTYITSNYATRYRQQSGTHAWEISASGTAGNAITFTQAMTLDASGNLGVGTTSPATYGKFVVQSTANTIIARSGGASFCEINVQSGASDAVKGQFQAIESTTNKVIIGSRTNHPLAFNISDTEKARIDTSGRLGIATTSPLNTLQINSFGGLDGNGNQFYLTNNYYFDSVDARDESIKAGYSNRIVLDNNSGGILFQTTSTSAAGANTAITLVERARIPAAGGFQSVNSISVGNATPTTSGAGVTFPATQSASSDANTLDDYEEGTWTPTLAWSTPGTSVITPTSSSGQYIKVGNMAYCAFNFDNATFTNGTASGYLILSGLPFTSSSSATAIWGGSITTNIGFPTNLQNTLVDTGATTATFKKSDGSASNVVVADVSGAGKYIRVAFMYRTA